MEQVKRRQLRRDAGKPLRLLSVFTQKAARAIRRKHFNEGGASFGYLYTLFMRVF